MPIDVKEIPDRLNSEKNRIRRIRDFLKENEGKAFTKEEIAKGTGMKCAGDLLSYGWKEFRESIHIKQVELIEIKEDGDYRFCATPDYFYYDPPKSEVKKEVKKKRIWKFWKKVN